MASARQCDICGGFFKMEDKPVVNALRITYENSYGRYASNSGCLPNDGRGMQICPACANAFVALYNSRRSQNDNRL